MSPTRTRSEQRSFRSIVRSRQLVRNANLRPLRVRRSNQSFENLAKATLSISVAFVFLLLAACGGQVRPEKTVVGATGNAEGQWRGKALVKDGRNGKSGTLDLDLIAKEPQALRIEAASSFGIPVASVAMSGGRIEVLLPQEKRFITSPADRGSLSRLIPVHISPLFSLFCSSARSIAVMSGSALARVMNSRARRPMESSLNVKRTKGVLGTSISGRQMAT